jgi:flagellar hook protein FlgE
MSFLDTLRSGTTGLKGFNTKLDVIGNNISNVSTTGFKGSRTRFFESYMSPQMSAIENADNTSALNPIDKGHGQIAPIIETLPLEGHYYETGNNLDLAVIGDGYFIVDNRQEQFYSRDGNFDLNENLDLIQDSSGSYIKGWSATLNADGETVIDVSGPLERISFESLVHMPHKSTTEVSYSSNLNGGATARQLQLETSEIGITDPEGNVKTYSMKLSNRDNNTYEMQLLDQNEQLLATFSSDIDRFGELGKWTVSYPENASVQDGDGSIHINIPGQMTYSEEKGDYEFPLTLSLPKESSYSETGSSFEPTLRAATYGESDFEDARIRSFGASFLKGETHSTYLTATDSVGNTHQFITSFERTDPDSNIWQYRVSLPANDPIIQRWLNDPDNNVENPYAPTEKEVSRANESIFGASHSGTLVFEGGLINEELSNIKPVTTQAVTSTPTYLRPLTVSSQDGSLTPMQMKITQPANGGYQYTLELPSDHPLIQKMAQDPQYNIQDPENLSSSELTFLNKAVFGSTNTGSLVFHESGEIDYTSSNIKQLNSSNAELALSTTPSIMVSESVPDILNEMESASGVINLTMDTSLITGFNADFSTKAYAQDGYPAGELKKSKIASDGDGALTGTYSNGQERNIGQIGIAVFRNTYGLKKEGNNLYSLSANSGLDETSIGKPNTDTKGLVLPGFLESSNVDLTTEMTEMILAQRMFQSNSKIISVSDQAINTALQMKK